MRDDLFLNLISHFVTEFAKLMNLRMGIKISSPLFDISFVIFKE